METKGTYQKLDCPFDFTSRCTMGRCDCKPIEEPKQETVEQIKMEEIKLTPVLGSSMCAYSVIENKLKTLYENQEKILLSIKLLSRQDNE